MITDICIIVFLIFFALGGYKKGFVKSVYSIVSLAATFLILFIFDKPLINAIANSPFGIAAGEFFANNTTDNLIVQSCSSAFVYLVSCIVLYIVIKIVLKFALKILDNIASLPFIKTINKFLGFFLGLVFGIIWAIVILNILSIFPKTEIYVLSSELVKIFNIIFI